jgi:hypothetical protein
MGQMTTLQIATTGKDSLRTTVPMSMVKHYELMAGDKLDWDFFIKDGEIVLIVMTAKRFQWKHTS